MTDHSNDVVSLQETSITQSRNLSKPLAINDIVSGEKEGFPRSESSWVTHCSKLQTDYKRAISNHVVTHLLGFSQVIQMGSGTTINSLMGAIIDFQTKENNSLDLTILTTNLEIARMGMEAADRNAALFRSTQVIITGGTLLESLYSLVGDYAAKNVHTELILPDIVFIGVAGIGFFDNDIHFSYHFEQELTTQESYATRKTERRIILCDHTKLGKTTRWQATKTNISQLLNDTNECIIISSYPDKEDSDYEEYVKKVDDQINRYKKMLEFWRKEWKNNHSETAQMRFRLITKKGEVKEEIKLWTDRD